MRYSEWAQQVSLCVREDSLWKMAAYRYALFISDIAWRDVAKLADDARTVKLAGQLYRAVGSIGANFAEGYSRGSGRDRARFYEYSLGSARESRTWYFGGRHILGDEVFAHRTELLAHVIKLALTMIPQQRSYGSIQLREDPPGGAECAGASRTEDKNPPPATLLENVPFSP